jgi:hypothetical protein
MGIVNTINGFEILAATANRGRRTWYREMSQDPELTEG